MSRNAAGKWWVSVVTLKPLVRFAGELQPDREQLAALHESAHAECYIANSVRTQLRIEPLWHGVAPDR
jgi:organic hydroperoxide reductase OsmC/OhrA